jgi:hypothetical protein
MSSYLKPRANMISEPPDQQGEKKEDAQAAEQHNQVLHLHLQQKIYHFGISKTGKNLTSQD